MFTAGKTSLNHSAFDFFIYRTGDRSLEIHLPGFAPTDWFNESRFGRQDDTSDPAQGRYFRTENNLPWAIQISDDWNYPREYIDILWAYPEYEQWVESSGQAADQWYKSDERKFHFYSVE